LKKEKCKPGHRKNRQRVFGFVVEASNSSKQGEARL